MLPGGKHPLIGLDLNASRIRAVKNALGQVPELVPINGEAELPLALSLEGRSPEVGRAGLALVRRSPHSTCTNFLPSLGDRREWSAGRHRLNADAALALVLDQLRAACAGAQAIVLAVPVYLNAKQIETIVRLAERSICTCPAGSHRPWR